MQNIKRFPQIHMYSVSSVVYLQGSILGGNNLLMYYSNYLLQEKNNL